MTVSSVRSLLHSLSQGLAIVALLAATALMAFIAGLALLGAMIAVPVAAGIVVARQHLPGGVGAAKASALWPAQPPARP